MNINIRRIGVVLYFVCILSVSGFSLPFEDAYTVMFGAKKVQYRPEYDRLNTTSVVWDSVFAIEVSRPKYEILEDSPLVKAIEIYLNHFETFQCDSTNALLGNFTEPYITTVSIDENIDGSYFFFENWNTYYPGSTKFNERHIKRHFLEDPMYGYVEYKSHIFLFRKSLLSNFKPIGIEKPFLFKIRIIEPTDSLGRKSINMNTDNNIYIKKFSMFIPWREVNK